MPIGFFSESGVSDLSVSHSGSAIFKQAFSPRAPSLFTLGTFVFRSRYSGIHQFTDSCTLSGCIQPQIIETESLAAWWTIFRRSPCGLCARNNGDSIRVVETGDRVAMCKLSFRSLANRQEGDNPLPRSWLHHPSIIALHFHHIYGHRAD